MGMRQTYLVVSLLLFLIVFSALHVSHSITNQVVNQVYYYNKNLSVDINVPIIFCFILSLLSSVFTGGTAVPTSTNSSTFCTIIGFLCALNPYVNAVLVVLLVFDLVAVLFNFIGRAGVITDIISRIHNPEGNLILLIIAMVFILWNSPLMLAKILKFFI
jgi:hypothetical protein